MTSKIALDTCKMDRLGAVHKEILHIEDTGVSLVATLNARSRANPCADPVTSGHCVAHLFMRAALD